METEGSPASILATRDWLERSRFASSTCDTPRRCRRSRRVRLRASFISMSAASASDRPRKSCTDPTRSEEHTSELQSRLHLVCRLLLEKKTCVYTQETLRFLLTL